FGIGRADAMRYTLKVQPVIPISLGKEWNLITRTIVPFIHAESPIPGGDGAGGIGDIEQSFFLSPKEPLAGWILGAGPVFLYPTASDDALGSGKWGAGPTAVYSDRITASRMVCWPTTSGRVPEMRIAPTSAPRSSSPSSPTRPRHTRPSGSTPNPPTTGRPGSGRCRST